MDGEGRGKGIDEREQNERGRPERGHPEEKPSQWEERFRSFFDHSEEMIHFQASLLDQIRNAVVATDLEGKIVYWNRFAERLYQWKPEEVIGKPVVEVMAPRILSSLKKGGYWEGELIEKRKDGSTFPAYQTNSPLRDRNGRVSGMVSVAIDITDRKRMEERLGESQRKYQNLVTHAKDAIFILQRGVIKYANPSGLALFECSEEELPTLSLPDLVHPEDREKVLERYFRRVKKRDVLKPLSFRVTTKEGETLWIEMNVAPIKWEGRWATLNFAREITAQKRLEAQYLQAQKMEAIGILAGGVAHSFNNLLQTIIGYADILLWIKQDGTVGEKELKEIKSAARKGADLTQRLLAFSLQAPGKPRPVSLNLEVLQLRRLLERTLPKEVVLEIFLDEHLRMIDADPAQIEQIVMNLALNARDAMPDGGRFTIRTRNVALSESFPETLPESDSSGRVLLTLTDTGHGMDQEVLDHLFEPFYTTKGVGKGTGLGLAMVYGLVKAHKGYIQCESKKGEGTTFNIYWPAAAAAAEKSVSEPDAEKPTGGTETILLVDDEDPIRNAGDQILRESGYRVLTAPDGEMALKVYQEEKARIQLVILDLVMPGMGGRKCAEELLRVNPEVKIIIASGYPVDSLTGETSPLKISSFIHKPYTMRQMLKAIRKSLDTDLP
jgi:PAS domain S-box-containing protein